MISNPACTAIDLYDTTASLELALQVASYFEVSQEDAHQIAHEVATAVSSWRTVAANFCIPTTQIERMASAFEHTDQKKALRSGPKKQLGNPRFRKQV